MEKITYTYSCCCGKSKETFEGPDGTKEKAKQLLAFSKSLNGRIEHCEFPNALFDDNNAHKAAMDSAEDYDFCQDQAILATDTEKGPFALWVGFKNDGKLLLFVEAEDMDYTYDPTTHETVEDLQKKVLEILQSRNLLKSA